MSFILKRIKQVCFILFWSLKILINKHFYIHNKFQKIKFKWEEFVYFFETK